MGRNDGHAWQSLGNSHKKPPERLPARQVMLPKRSTQWHLWCGFALRKMNQHFIKWLNLTTTLQKTEDREHSEQSWMVERPFNSKDQLSWANRVPGSHNDDSERDFHNVSTSFHLVHNQPSIFPDAETSDADSQSYYAFFFLNLLPFCFGCAAWHGGS